MRKAAMSCLCGLLGPNATVMHNSQQNGIEVKFSSKPEDSDISFLKSNGFRWSGHKHLWYARYSDFMFKKIEAKFNEQSGSSPAAPAKPQPPAEQTFEQKAEHALRNFNAIMQTNSIVRDLFQIAQDGIKKFLDNLPPEVKFPDHTLTYDKAKGEYWFLPAKRKRPDWYGPGYVFNSILDLVTRKGGNPGLLKHVKYKRMQRDMYSKWTFDYFIRERPQYYLDPDYGNINRYFNDLEKWSTDEALRWQEWFDKYMVKGTTVYTKTGQSWYDRKIESLGNRFGDGEFSLLELHTKRGWITEVGTYPISSVYDQPEGNSMDKLYPETRPNAYGEIPRFHEYTGEIPVTKPEPAPNQEPKPEPVSRNLNYFIEYLQKAGIDFKKLNDKLWDKAADVLKEVPIKELVFSGTQNQRIHKIIQMAAYKYLSDQPDYEMTEDAYSLKRFIKSAFTEAMLMDESLYIPSSRNMHLKKLLEAKEQGKTIPAYVIDQYPELRQSAPTINLLKMKMKAKALKLKLKLN